MTRVKWLQMPDGEIIRYSDVSIMSCETYGVSGFWRGIFTTNSNKVFEVFALTEHLDKVGYKHEYRSRGCFCRCIMASIVDLLEKEDNFMVVMDYIVSLSVTNASEVLNLKKRKITESNEA